MRKTVFNKKYQKERRQNLRHELTRPEQILWQRIRGKQLGVKFRRQHGIGDYIVDFYASEIKLVIELDGDSHYTDDAQAYDKIRNEFMESLGLTILRFTNNDIMKNIDGVCQVLLDFITCFESTPPQPSPSKGEGA